MIKRRFYKLEHGDHKDEPSDSSSSSSDSQYEAEAFGEEIESDGDGVTAEEATSEGCSTSSGYESEDRSANEVDIDSSGLPVNDEGDESGELQVLGDNRLSDKRSSRILDKQSKHMEENEPPAIDFPACVLKCKSVFKCRICPRIVCLNEESLRAHLKSKRHSRSEKLLNEGRLKATLNSDGEIDNEEMAANEGAEIGAASQDKPKGGQQRQHRRRQNKRLKKKKLEQDSGAVNKRSSKETPANKRRKQEK